MKNRKGFTIVELVIVIAVVAILAAVLIPTFSTIVKNASISSDTQLVRNMNVALAAESADGTAPADGFELVSALRENGFTEYRPQTKFCTFYWLKNENVIILTNEDRDPVFPEEYVEERYDPDSWINLEDAAGMPPLPTAPSENIDAPREFTVSVTVSGGPQLEFGVDKTATEGKPLKLQFVVPEGMRIRYQIKSVTALMEDGEKTHKIDVTKADDYDTNDYPEGFSIFEIPFTVDIPCVTGNIEVRVTVKEFCRVTIIGDNAEHLKATEWSMWFEKGISLSIPDRFLDEYLLKEGYGITSAIANSDIQDFGEVYNEEMGYIHSRNVNVTRDLTVKIQTAWKTYQVQLIIKDQNNNILLNHQATVYYDTEKDDAAYSFPLPSVLADKEFEFIYQPHLNLVAKDDKRKPIYEYDSAQFAINVSNIKYDFVLTYFVKIPE